MAHGTPDWGADAAKKTVYSGIDLAELAARLGSIVKYDRRGDVVWLDDFTDGLEAWRAQSTVVGDLPAWSAAYFKSGGFSCRLHTSAVAARGSAILRYFSIPVLSKMGLEVCFTCELNLTLNTIYIVIANAVATYHYHIRYNSDNNRLEYAPSAVAWTPFATGVIPYPTEHLFHNLKMVIDAVKGEFIGVIFGDTVYSLAGIAAYTLAGVGTPYAQALIMLENTGDAAREMYVDDVIFTQNEP